jgi:hypothetical protein
MILYHGSNTQVEAVDLLRCRPNKDFGQGFYLTPDKSAAEKMALRTVRRFGGTPFLMTYDFDEAQLEKLNQKLFEVSSVEWAMFVMANRRADNNAKDHNLDNKYDVVVGPVANDDLALLFRQFSRGLLTVEMLMREMQFKRLTTQYSFHTQYAVSLLRLVEVHHVD